MVAVFARVLAQIILFLCFAAGMVASCIIFVLYGPVPVRRKVTVVSRLSPPDPFLSQPAARVVLLPQPTDKAPALPQVRFFAQPQSSQSPQIVALPQQMQSPPKQQVAPGVAYVRPRSTPTPLPRNRSARGTERRPRPSELELTTEHTIEHTLETPMVELDDADFLEDGR